MNKQLVGRGTMRRKTSSKYASKTYRPKDEDEGSNEPIFAPKLRTCRSCEIQTHNYFFCYSCQVRMKSKNPDLFYASEIGAE